MNKRIWLYCLLYALIAACSSDEDDGQGTVVFHVAVDSVAAYSVTATITHNGSNRDSYCSFVVDGSVGNVQDVIDSYMSTLSEEAARYLALKWQRKKIVRLSGLLPQHTYTYIVFGLTEEGQQYGVPATVTFTTDISHIELQEYPMWKLNYEGFREHLYNYYACVGVEDNGPANENYFVAEYDVETINRFGSDAHFLPYIVEDYKNRLKQHSSDSAWEEDLLPRSGSSHHYAHLETGRTYVAYAVGITESGDFSGHYAKSEPFTIDEYPMLGGYADLVERNLVSTWLLDSEDEITSLTATLYEDVRNESILMRWKEFSILWKFSIIYTAKDASLTVRQQLMDESTYVKIDRTNVRGKLYLKGWYLDQHGDTVISSQTNIAHGELQSDGSYRFVPLMQETATGLALVLEKADYQTIIVPGAVLNMPFIMRKK